MQQHQQQLYYGRAAEGGAVRVHQDQGLTPVRYRLNGVAPDFGDRVLVARIGHDWVALGALDRGVDVAGLREQVRRLSETVRYLSQFHPPQP